MRHTDNPIVALSEALHRLEHHDFGLHPCRGTTALVDAARAWDGEPDAELALGATGSLARLLVPTLRNTYNATELHAGLQHNVVPPVAEALIDGRFVPGRGLPSTRTSRTLSATSWRSSACSTTAP